MSLVADASATLAWVYTDEQTALIREVFARVRTEGAWVPGLWHLEIANSLQVGVRKKRLSLSLRDSTLIDLAELPIQVDWNTNDFAWNTTIRLADRHELTLYDAA
jgi:predicted nucleic acid-binding protein